MPWSLCVAFSHSRQYPLQVNEYMNGESQRQLQASTSRKSWKLARRVTSDQLALLRAFVEARKGPTQPFYFYDVWETSPKFSYDATGVAVAGRYVVRFDGPWSHALNIARIDVSAFSLIEIV